MNIAKLSLIQRPVHGPEESMCRLTALHTLAAFATDFSGNRVAVRLSLSYIPLLF